MKKKIAALLAFALTMSVMPVTIFAASDNRLSRDTLSLSKQTLLYDEQLTLDKLADAEQGLVGTQQTSKGDTISHYTRGMDLVIQLKDPAKPGDAFRIELENGEWCFDNSQDGSGDGTFASYQVVDGRISPVPDEAYTYRYNAGTDINYHIRVSPFNMSSATVTFLSDNVDDPLEPQDVLARTNMRIPLLTYVKDENVQVIARITDNNSPVSTSGGGFLLATTSEGTTITRANSIRSGRETISLDKITIKETQSNALRSRGAFELIAPAGYSFRDNFSIATGSVFNVHSEPGLGAVQSWGYKWTDNVNYTSIALFVDMATTPSSRLSGTLALENLILEPLDHFNIIFDETLSLEIANYENTGIEEVADIDWIIGGQRTGAYGAAFLGSLGNSLSVKNETFSVAKTADWAVSVTAAEPRTLISGRSATDAIHAKHQTARVTLEEQESGSWFSNRTNTFRIPEGVEIIGVRFNTRQNVGDMTDSDTIRRPMDIPGTETKLTNGVVTIAGNEMTIRNIQPQNTNNRSKLEFTLYVSIDPNFEGDITMQTFGTAFTDTIEDLVIGTVVPPIVVSSTSKDIQIGYQRYSVSDITISETQAGAIERQHADSKLILAIKDYTNSNRISFAQPSRDSLSIEEGDINVTLANTRDGTITLNVERASRHASVIKLTDLEVRVDRTIPWGSYDLVVYGDSVYQNYTLDELGNTVRRLGTFGQFEEGFLLEKYINVVSEGANPALQNNVRVTAGSNILTVNNETIIMDTPAMIDPTSHSVLVPFRAVLNALGIQDSDIYWDASTSTVTIVSASNSRTISLTADSDVMVINGARQTMVTNGHNVRARIVNDRMHVPLRYVALGLGLSNDAIYWNEGSGTAEFNPISVD